MASAPNVVGYNLAINFSISWLNKGWYENIERPYAYCVYNELLTAGDLLGEKMRALQVASIK